MTEFAQAAGPAIIIAPDPRNTLNEYLYTRAGTRAGGRGERGDIAAGAVGRPRGYNVCALMAEASFCLRPRLAARK